MIASIVERHGNDGLVLATMMAGMMMIAVGLLRFGRYVKYITFPVTVGFTAGIAVIMHAFYSLLFMLAAAPLARYIPLAALGAVLAIVAWNMAEKAEFASLLQSSSGDATVLMATFLLTIFADLTTAIATGVTLGAFLFLHRMAEAVEVEGGGHMISEDKADTPGDEYSPYDPATLDGDVLVYRISGAFFFGATATVSGVLDRIGALPRVFVLDFKDVPLVDSTAAKTLERFVHKLDGAGTRVYFSGAGKPVRRTLLSAGLRKPKVRYTSTAEDAISLDRVLQASGRETAESL